jgi:hypothetical protein
MGFEQPYLWCKILTLLCKVRMEPHCSPGEGDEAVK